MATGSVRVIVWDAESRKSAALLDKHRGDVTAVAFATDHPRRLYTASADGTVIVWLWKRAMAVASFVRHDAGLTAVMPCPLGGHAQIATATANGRVFVWDLESGVRAGEVGVPVGEGDTGGRRAGGGDPESVRPAHDLAVLAVAFSVTGRTLATACGDGSCSVWAVASLVSSVDGRRRPELLEAEARRRAEQAAGGGRDLISIADHSAAEAEEEEEDEPLVGPACLQLVTRVGHERACTACAFSRDDTLLVTASLDTTIRVWSSLTGLLLFQINTPSPVYDMSLASDGTIVAASGTRLLSFALSWVAEQRSVPLWAAAEASGAESAAADAVGPNETNAADGSGLASRPAGRRSFESPLPPQTVGPRAAMPVEASPWMRTLPADLTRASLAPSGLLQMETDHNEGFYLADLSVMLARGHATPRALFALARHFGVDLAVLMTNLGEHGLTPMEVLRAAGRCEGNVGALLAVLADPDDGDTLLSRVCRAIALGASVADLVPGEARVDGRLRRGRDRGRRTVAYWQSASVPASGTWRGKPLGSVWSPPNFDRLRATAPVAETRDDNPWITYEGAGSGQRPRKPRSSRGGVTHIKPTERERMVRQLWRGETVARTHVAGLLDPTAPRFPNLSVEAPSARATARPRRAAVEEDPTLARTRATRRKLHSKQGHPRGPMSRRRLTRSRPVGRHGQRHQVAPPAPPNHSYLETDVRVGQRLARRLALDATAAPERATRGNDGSRRVPGLSLAAMIGDTGNLVVTNVVVFAVPREPVHQSVRSAATDQHRLSWRPAHDVLPSVPVTTLVGLEVVGTPVVFAVGHPAFSTR